MPGMVTYGIQRRQQTATSAELEVPSGIRAFDSAGNLYIADTLQRASSAKSMHRHGIITTVAGTPPTTSNSGYSYPQNGYSETAARQPAPSLIGLKDWRWTASRQSCTSPGLSEQRHSQGDGQQRDHHYRSWKRIDMPPRPAGMAVPATDFSLCFPQSVSVDSTGNLYIPYGTGEIKEVTVSAATPTTATAAPCLQRLPLELT